MINNVVLVGRMTRDPELRRTNMGSAVANFTLAVNRNYNSADGVQADFLPCVVWNKSAENVEKYCSKGSLVGVEGRLRSRSYDNAQGQKVFVVEVVCDSVQFLETRAARERAQQQQPQVPQDNFYNTNTNTEMKTIDLEKEFNNSLDSFDIMEDDIQF